MNCGDFRYLVQRRFDVELSPQDDRALLIHLETCDSCQKFYHQVQQVIIAAEELELMEDLLPQEPEGLLRKILENLPTEKVGIKDIILSFLNRLFHKTESQIQDQGGLLPHTGQVSNLKRQILSVPNDFVSSSGGQEIAQQASRPGMNWSAPAPVATVQNITHENNEEQSLSANQDAQTDQVITRSLGQKFGVSGIHSQLSNNQSYSLAESIKQKISEMSKSSEHQTIIRNVKDTEASSEPLDEWTIPHSPQWPKLNADISPEQWPNEMPGTRAPNTWGSISNWDNPIQTAAGSTVSDFANHANEVGVQAGSVQPNNDIFNQSPAQLEQDFRQAVAENHQPEDMLNKSTTWSPEAEQLETGRWQTLKLDTALGATGYPPAALSSPASLNNLIPQAAPSPLPTQSSSPSITMPSFPMASPAAPSTFQASSLIPTVSPALPVAQEPGIPELNAERPAESSAPLPQAFSSSPASLPAKDAGKAPRIYTVVSKRTQANSSTASTIGAEINSTAVVQPPLVSPETPSTINTAMANPSTKPPLPSQPSISSFPPQTFPAIQATSRPSITPPSQALSKDSIASANPVVQDDKSHLFNFDDGAIDQIFSKNLGIHERVVPTQPIQQKESFPTDAVIPEFQATVAPSQSISAAASSSADQIVNSLSTKSGASNVEVSNLLTVDDNLIDHIFTDTLGVPEHISKNVVGKPMHNPPLPTQPIPLKEEIAKDSPLPTNSHFDTGMELSSKPINNISSLPSSTMPDLAESVGPSFGETSPSSYSAGKQKIVGVGKLDDRNEPVNNLSSGRIASIGKFLLDNKDLEKIGKITASDLSDSRMRTLTVEADEELKNLLKQIDAQDGVTGSVIVGHDGLLIANTMPQEIDPESIGVWALGVFMGTTHAVEKLGDDNVRQIVSQTNQGYLIIANFGAGILVTLTTPIMLDKLLPLMRTITQLVAA